MYLKHAVITLLCINLYSSVTSMIEGFALWALHVGSIHGRINLGNKLVKIGSGLSVLG